MIVNLSEAQFSHKQSGVPKVKREMWSFEVFSEL